MPFKWKDNVSHQERLIENWRVSSWLSKIFSIKPRLSPTFKKGEKQAGKNILCNYNNNYNNNCSNNYNNNYNTYENVPPLPIDCQYEVIAILWLDLWLKTFFYSPWRWKWLQLGALHQIGEGSGQGMKLRLIQAPMRLNFSLWRPNPES